MLLKINPIDNEVLQELEEIIKMARELEYRVHKFASEINECTAETISPAFSKENTGE